MAPSNVAHTHPFSLALCPAWCVCACQPHALLPLQQTHNMPLLLNNHNTTTSHWCCNHTTCCPNTHNTTTPPIIHQLAIVSPCPPPSHATACHTAALQQHTPVWPFAPVHTHHQVCVMASPHTTQPSTTGMCICGCVWCTVVGLHTHSFCVGFTTPQTPCAGSSMRHAHANCTTTHTQLGVVHHAMQPHHTHGYGGCVWCSGGCVGWLAQPPSLLVMPSMWCAAPVSSHHNLVPSSTRTLCHPHNNHHCTVWCHLGNNHQPTNHANQPHSWCGVCGVVCCT